MTKVIFAISTLGNRPAELRSLLESIARQTLANDCSIAICDQSPAGLDPRLIDNLNILVEVVPGTGGAARGRNILLEKTLPDAADAYWAFPNDTSRYAVDYVQRVLRHATSAPNVMIGSYRDGPRDRHWLPQGQSALTRRNVWRALEACTLVSSRYFYKYGLFDDSIGTGSSSLRQSGEMTDLLLRSILDSQTVVWDPELRTYGVSQNYGLSGPTALTKEYGYARGYMHVRRRHSYSHASQAVALVGPLIKMAAIPSSSHRRLLWARFLGRYDEIRLRTTPRSFELPR